MGVASVAVYSEADVDALHVRLADEAVAIGPAPGARELLARRQAARRRRAQSGADAVHPGYGFLAENAGFARAVRDAGLDLHRPARRRRSRPWATRSRRAALMEAAGVPVVPATGTLAARGRRRSAPAAAAVSAIPVVDQGRGRRRRQGHAHRAPARGDRRTPSAGAAREAHAAFGDGRIYLERYLERPRHVEVQVFADTHGTRRAPRRARVLDPAPPPEDRRGVALARPSTPTLRAAMTDAGDPRRVGRRLRRRRHDRVPARRPTAASTSSR